MRNALKINFLLMIGTALIASFVSLGTSLAAGNQQSPQLPSYEGEKVAIVDLIAKPTLDIETLRPLVLQKAGEPYSAGKIQDTVAALGRTGLFSKIDIEVTPEAAGLRIVFVLQPAYYIGIIDFPGALDTFSYPRLLQVVNYPAEQPYEQSRMKAAVPALLRFFASNGYFAAQVQSESKLDESRQLADLVFHVTLKKRARIGRVEIIGLEAAEAARLQSSLHSVRARVKSASLIAGKPYEPERIRAATKFIIALLGKENRLASQVRLEPPQYDPETNRARLTFQVTSGPSVSVRTDGARVSKRTLRKLIPIYEENSFDQDLVEEGRRNLISYFQSHGYFDVRVNSQIEDEPARVSVVYQIDKGSQHRVVELAFRGNHHFTVEDLLNQIEIRRGQRLSRGKFSSDLLNRSVEKLAAYYRDAGFPDVSIKPSVVDRDSQVNIVFQIAEGAQTIVDALHVEGNATQTIRALAPGGLKLGPGKTYSQQLLNHDRNQIMATYLDLGYLNAVFRSSVKPLPERPHHVDVTYTIQEGPQARIKDVAILGGGHTQRKFIARSVGIQSGAPLSQGKMLASESALYDAGVFDLVSVAPRKAITDQTEEDVLVKVHEAKRNTLTYGIGFEFSPRTGNIPEGTVALPGLPVVSLPSTITITQKNFASPRGSIEYSRGNMRGRGETASVSMFAARLDQRGLFTYGSPHIGGTDWSSLFSVSAERTSENPIFTARLGEAGFQVQRPLNKDKTKTLLFRYNFRRTDLTEILIPDLVPPQDESVRLSTLAAGYVRDTRDKPLDAHRGILQTLDFGITPKAFGSSAGFARFLGQMAYYRQVRPSLVWANNMRLGLAKPFGGNLIPLSERYYSGGAASLRGFPVNGAGPQRTVQVCNDASNPSPSTCTNILVPVGGNQLFIFNSELRFPIPLMKGLGGVLFYDGGNVYERIGFSRFFIDYSNTIGFGLRYDTPVGPIRIDLGHNLNPVTGMKSTQFFISLGQAF
ncbi:MAG: BamA/TamA family outer membrane protein [Acidobacteriia bacterium]|nr:BamA/TamA family outer membrane protein [Terriglobia bacterium]